MDREQFLQSVHYLRLDGKSIAGIAGHLGVNRRKVARALKVAPVVPSPIATSSPGDAPFVGRQSELHQLKAAQSEALRQAFTLERPGVDFNEAEFDTVIRHAQAQGLVWSLSFGDFVLLQPELLNDYASAIVRVARKHPEGLGCVLEHEVLEARIDFEDMVRLVEPGTERSLIHAVAEIFLARDIALREGEHLVFPSKFNRERPEYPRPPLHEVAYSFAGPVEEIYATLVVRLSYSGAFELGDLWKNAAEFTDTLGMGCGFIVSSPAEGEGVISAFFEGSAPIDTKVLLLTFVNEHLRARAIVGSDTRKRIYRCSACNEEVADNQAVAARLDRGMRTVPCQYCDAQVQLRDLLEERFGDQELLRRVRAMEAVVASKKEEQLGITKAKAKEGIGEFDVFLAHNNTDSDHISAISESLRQRALNPWLDREQIAPGRWFQDVIQQAILSVKSAAIFIGPSGLGKWQVLELRAFVEECVDRDIPVIPVLLPGVTRVPHELPFLKQFNWVRFRNRVDEKEGLRDLVWGITGERPR